MQVTSRAKGFTIIETVIVLAIMGAVFSLFMLKSEQEVRNTKARILGKEIHQVHTALRKFASLNAANENLRASGDVIVHNDLSWLKDTATCPDSTGNMNYINCDASDVTSIFSLPYRSEINPTISDTLVSIKTVIKADEDLFDSGRASDEMLAIASMIARGGVISNNLSIDGINTSTSDPAIANTSSQVIYCNKNLPVATLNPNCTDIGSGVVEGGMIVMITTSDSTASNWLLTNGGNSMHNNLTFDSSNDQMREIDGVNRIYNLAGEVLKLGNSGIYFDDGSFSPILGAGIVIDTDLYSIGSLTSKGDVISEGDAFVKGNIYSENGLYSKGNIVTEGDMEVWGDNVVFGDSFVSGNLTSYGGIVADRIKSNTFIQAQEISSDGGIYAGQLVNAPVIRASINLVSEGDLSVDGDTIIGGNEYVSGNSITDGNLFSGGDIIADTGTAYLNNAYVSAIYDNDGNFMVDPSGISRFNIMRADRLAPSTSGGTLTMNSNNFLFTSESADCNTASNECATALEGYWDIENLYVKNNAENRWERLVDWMARSSVSETSNDSNSTNNNTNTGNDNGNRPTNNCGGQTGGGRDGSLGNTVDCD